MDNTNDQQHPQWGPPPLPGAATDQPAPWAGQERPATPWPPHAQPPAQWPNHPAPPPPWQAPNQTPWQAPSQAPPRTGKFSPALWTLAVITVLAVAYSGFITINTMRGSSSADGKHPAPAGTAAPSAAGDSSSAAEATKPPPLRGKVPPGSRASSFPVRTMEDLERVCDGRYYPKSPKYRGAAPHPIAIKEKTLSIMTGSWMAYSSIRLPDEASAAVEAAWEPKNPKDVQLVACVDLIKTGPRVGTCKVTDPKPETVVVKEGIYRVSLYEVSTRRRLLQVQMSGENTECVMWVYVGADGKTVSTVHHRQLYEALRRYVEQ
ncbi:MAG TPA: hypothetical protein VFO77_14585 [Actinoplanes sp.]|nr:hypothetical protein [Actinoplanes sp.]